MGTRLSDLSDAGKARAVCAFNARFGEMERALWCLSVNSRAALIRGEATAVVEALVWTVKSWWGVQGVRSDTKPLMARALPAALDWRGTAIGEAAQLGSGAEEFACECVFGLVDRSRAAGVRRREFSLSSKVLHWLLPYQIPAYDAYICRSLGIAAAAGHPHRAYRQVAEVILGIARTAPVDAPWLGTVEPRSPVRALDKCLWWLGGGAVGNAALVRNPWQVVDRLALDRDDS
jgi:hypothetical protein